MYISLFSDLDMDSKQFADSYIMANQANFPTDKIHLLRDKLLNLPEERQVAIQTIALKNPTTTLLLSLFGGAISLDRFYLGLIGSGVLKILSLFIFIGFIWALADIFICYKKAKEINFNNVMLVL